MASSTAIPIVDTNACRGIWEDGVFDRVVADHGTVMRPNGADLCPDEIYDNSVRD